ncbi:hypothetical protein HP397_01820 [Streptobacillus felis]|uniref:Uncharacterized protein n=1 Tax=Streptobacillus felis TaxID=1384509 RepID=A0A7Z0PE57_9FUSO|nr:hypothetical protein [Streptobacillus felis]NYV27566.1 hypothetical protein [Streptobacillus felis]
MIIIPVKISKDNDEIIKAYLKIHNLDFEKLIKDLIIKKIKEENIIEEKFILEKIENNKKNRIYTYLDLIDKMRVLK